MRIHGIEIPSEAIAAGKRAMAGEFEVSAVIIAMRPHMPADVPAVWSDTSFASEAANRLLQRERKAGRIRYERKVWRVVL